MKPITAQESARRWHVLLNRKRETRVFSSSGDRTAVAVQEDPFDCSSVAIPTPQGLVDSTLQQFVHQWKQLDARKVIQDEDDMNNLEDDEDEETSQSEGRKRRRRDKKDRSNTGWLAHRLKLPEIFDYASQRAEPPPDTDNSEKVISLVNPLLHVSYEQELWKLFQSVPTSQELEEDAVERHQLHHTFQLYTEMTHGLRDNGRLDGHALSRMRMNDRHGLPSQHKTRHQQPSQPQQQHFVSTVRLEIWRRQQQPKRGPSPDPHRMVLEFLGEQTLLDVHLAMVELSEDDLWDDNHDKNQLTTTTAADNNNNNSNEDDGSQNDDSDEPSGAFFIESVLYTCGKVDYAAPIRRWIDDDEKRRAKLGSRREFLGIPASNSGPQASALSSLLSVKSMSQTKLDSIPWRLGFRYYHAHHGDVESAVFASDVRFGSIYRHMSYPILHDMWCPSSSMTECEACQHRPATLVTPPSCKRTDGGPRAICDACYCHLKKSCLDADQQDELKVTRYSIWRDQPDLSLAASSEAFF